ncbi:hypothetical protein NM688_g3503 [Phlebia brevispora]|uniref:Uncharacterized protein n=1 Tax=Phlebia brevispora TaxID=194682 RepID=A0ACC1T5R9_9APHY|nr:hypothetical protein NM688_g3503 [Phlebia brevispora]
MDSKKRARTEDSEPPSSKKRALSDHHGSPVPLNGTSHETDEPRDDDNLELFRKDAIFRRMKHYSRENEKSQAKIAELERRRDTCEAGLAALEACWTQLLNTIRSLVKPEELSDADISARDVYDLTARVSSDADSQYVEQLRVKMQATEQLVVAFVKLGKQGGLKVTQEDTFKQCQEAQTECTSLRSEVSLLHAKLNTTESEKDSYRDRLVAAEKRIDRLQSKTVAAMNLHKVTEKHEIQDESRQATPSSPTPPQPPNGIQSPDTDEWEAVAKHREEKIQQLCNENLELQQDLLSLKLAAKNPPETMVRETPFYKALIAHASKLEQTVSDYEKEINQLKFKIQQLEAARLEVERQAHNEQEKAIQEYRNMVVKRDNENSRLREQREQILSELNERKQKDMIKIHSVNELKALVDSRSERIKVLESELTRLRTRLAADAKDEDLMTFFFKSGSEEVSYVADLKRRLAEAEEHLKASEGPSPGETELRRQLAVTKMKLEEYKIFGDAAFPPDVQALANQLKEKQGEIDRLQSLEKQHEQAESSLYAELEKLSVAWEALDRQVKNKVFDLAGMEEKVSKTGLEKAKADNKYYAAMRDKEASDAERKAISRAYDKQTQVVEKLLASEKTLILRVADLEREASYWKHAAEQQAEHAKKLEGDNGEWQVRANGERARTTEALAAIRKHEVDLKQKREELRHMEENIARSKKEAERHAAKMKTSSQHHSASPNSREAELQSEVDKCMDILKCSTCRQNMRNTVITKCMHKTALTSGYLADSASVQPKGLIRDMAPKSSSSSSSSKETLKEIRAKKGKELLDYHLSAAIPGRNNGANLPTLQELARMVAEGRDFRKVRDTTKIKPKKMAEYQKLVASVPDMLKEPSRSLEELLSGTDAITASEALKLGTYAEGRTLTPSSTDRYLSGILFAGDVWLLGKHISQRVAEATETLEEKYGPIYFDDTVPYKKEKAEAVAIAAKQTTPGLKTSNASRETIYQLIWKGVLSRQDSRDPEEVERTKEAFAMAQILIQHGVPVDEQDIMGNTALIYATGCHNKELMSNVKFGSLLLKGGADVNHRNRQGHTALSLASMSSVTWGEDRKRSVPVRWLLQHGANPDIPDNGGFTPRMNGQYSKVITKLFHEEDKRRAELPPHCVFCLYIPPDDFEPGMEGVGGGPFLLKEKEMPKTLMLCACKSEKALYCSKKCQKADWKHHKKTCKIAKS